MTSTVGRKGSAKEKRLPGGCKFTDDMTEDQKLEHIQERKEYMLSKKTRKQEIASWGTEALQSMEDFFIEFDLSKAKGGKDFKIATEFKRKLDVPNPNIDDLRLTLKTLKESQEEADKEILQIRTNIADACEMTVEDIDGELGDKMRDQIKKGRPKVNKGPSYVPKHMLAKGWDIRYTTKNDVGVKEEGKPYYVHIMRQLSQWDPPDREKDGDPATPPPTPDPELTEMDAGWYVKIRDKDSWEPIIETRYWRKDIQTGVPTRAQRIQQLLDIMRSDEGQEKATSPIYGAKRRYRHKNPDANWDEGGLLIVPEKAKKEDAAEPEQKDGEGDAEGGEGDEGEGGEGDEDEEESSEEEDEDVALCQKVDDFAGEKFNKVFPEALVQLMPRRLQNKSCKVKFEYPRGLTPPPTPPESNAGDEDGGDGDGGGYEDSDGGGFDSD